jgi:hypothetical protein
VPQSGGHLFREGIAMRTFVSVIVAAGLLVEPAFAAPSVKAEHGNIVLHDGKTVRPLTRSGHDSHPILSPDGKRVAFVRHGAKVPGMKLCADELTGDFSRELWSISANGGAEKRLLVAHGEMKRQATVCDFQNLQFNSTGQLLYFETPAWATSGASHVFDFKSGKEHFVVPSNETIVLSHCSDEQYRDDLVVAMHRYYAMGGSYDWYWLIAPNGKEIGPLGESAGMARDECS